MAAVEAPLTAEEFRRRRDAMRNLPEVFDLGRKNQPCYVNGNWQAHVWVEVEWWIDLRCDCLPMSGLELRCQHCGVQASDDEDRIHYSTHARTRYGAMLDPSRPYYYNPLKGERDDLELPF